MLCSVVCTAGALVTITAKNPIRGAVGLLATIIGIAGLFLKLRAEFLAAIQLIVYAGAVVVLFVFVLMLLGSATVLPPSTRARWLSRWVAGAVMGLSAAAALVLLISSRGEATTFGPAPEGLGSVQAMGHVLFTDALAVFELSTALLIVAVIGAIAVARGKQGVLKGRAEVKDPRKFFSGPLLTRDVRPGTHPASVRDAARVGEGS
jgi:NADH-quinone oxidoreductase subunit J